MNYGCTVWGYAGGNVLNVIHRLENKSARAITCNYDYINVRGDDICKGLGLTRFQTRRYYFTSVLMFKAIHGITPHYITNMILCKPATQHTTQKLIEYGLIPHDGGVVRPETPTLVGDCRAEPPVQPLCIQVDKLACRLPRCMQNGCCAPTMRDLTFI